MLQQSRSARFQGAVDKQIVAVTDQTLIPAPVDGRIVIDWLYFNSSVASTVEFKSAAGAWTNQTGLLGGTFGANGGFIHQVHTLELPDGAPLVYSTTGASPTTYVSVGYHREK